MPPSEAPAAPAETTETKPFWGLVNGKDLEIPIIGVTGPKGSGKTLFASLIDVEGTIMIDLEDSAASYNLPFKQRLSLYEQVKGSNGKYPTPRECWEWFEGFVQGLPDGAANVLAVDPITDIQQGLVDWVKAHPDQFGHTADQHAKASGLLWADVKQHLKMFLLTLSKKVRTFVFTTHMGAVWRAGKPVEGRTKAKGVDTFFEVASLYLYLERPVPPNGKQPDEPIGCIAPPHGKSRLAHTTIKDGKVTVQPILPPRIVGCTPNRIREYIAKPPDYSKLKAAEQVQVQVMTDDERLQVQREVAELENETEQLKSSRLAQMKAAQERNLARQQENAQAAVQEQAGSALQAEAEKPQAETRSLLNEMIRGQFKDLGIDKQTALRVLAKRGVSKIADLTDEQAAELRQIMWDKLTQRDMEAQAKK